MKLNSWYTNIAYAPYSRPCDVQELHQQLGQIQTPGSKHHQEGQPVKFKFKSGDNHPFKQRFKEQHQCKKKFVFSYFTLSIPHEIVLQQKEPSTVFVLQVWEQHCCRRPGLAGVTLKADMRSGKFQGITWPVTPIGSCRTWTCTDHLLELLSHEFYLPILHLPKHNCH